MGHPISKKNPPLLILLLLASFASIMAVLFTPALPEISEKLGVADGPAQLTVSIFLIGYAIGNLPYGPISNRFGRKPAAYLGIVLAALGSCTVVLAGKLYLFWLVLIGRFLMALGSSVGMKIAFTMIGDCYPGEQATKKISYIMLAFAIGPGLAIAMGGFLTTQFGWESCFYFLTGYSLFVLLAVSLLPETSPHLDPDALKLNKIKTAYLDKIKNKKLILSALLMGCGTSFVYLFASEAPFIGIKQIGLAPNIYGLFNFIPPIGMIAGTFASHALASKKHPVSVIFLGICISSTASLLMLALFALDKINPATLFFPMPFIYLGLSLIFSNASAFALSQSENKSNASAMMNFINMSLCVLILFSIEPFPTPPPLILPAVFVSISLLMLLLHRSIKKQIDPNV